MTSLETINKVKLRAKVLPSPVFHWLQIWERGEMGLRGRHLPEKCPYGWGLRL